MFKHVSIFRPKISISRQYRSQGLDVAKRDRLGILFFGSICASSFGLGVWQTKRYFWKENLVQESNILLKFLPTELPIGFAQEQILEYVTPRIGQRIKLKGTFDHKSQVLVGPRSAPADLLGGSKYILRAT